MVEPDIDAEPGDLLAEPAHDADELPPPGRAGGKQNLAAEQCRGLEQHDIVAAPGGDPRGLEPAQTPADHDDFPLWAGALLDELRQRLFAARGDVVDALRIEPLDH